MDTETLPSSLSSYKPSPNEKEAFLYLFNKADTDGLGVLTGDRAVPFFSHSSIQPALLGQIWEACDPDNSGFLTTGRFGVACRLIGHAQAQVGGSEISPAWVGTAGPLPALSGFPIPAHLIPSTPVARSPAPAARIIPQATGPRLVPQTTGGGLAGQSITPEEKKRYADLFANSGPVGGLLDGDKAHAIFIKSKLPFDVLGQIWNLADTHSRGSLDVADFTVGMHLIQHTMNGHLQSLPTSLSPALYASAASLPVATPSYSLPPPAQPRMTPASPLRQTSFPAPQSFAAVPPQQQAWDITAAEKSESDGYFDGLDATRQGAIEGEAAVGFFGMSGLDISILARVWDLADIRGTGTLNKDEFAVALKLIRDKVAGKELPAVLPASMIPPSLRAANVGPQHDLLDLMEDNEPIATTPIPSQPIFQQNTGGSAARGLQRQYTGASNYEQTALQGTIFPQATGASARSAETLSPQTTGFGDNFGQSRAIVPSSSNFFDDNDDADQSARLTADSVTLGNLQNQHTSVSSAVTQLSTKRVDLETSLATTTSAINELQVKLSQARAAHETERGMVDNLEGRQKEQATLLARARHELIAAESDLSALRVERTELEGTYLRDKEEVREMKKKMAQVSIDVKEAKDALEKLKKDARQQKGLVAISKKQLVTAEGEHEKVVKDLEETTREVQQPFDAEASPFDHAEEAAALPLPISPPAVTSPTSSVRSTNPFDRIGSITHAITPSSSTPTTPSFVKSPIAAVAAVVGVVGAGVATVLGVKGEEEQKEDTPAPSTPRVEEDATKSDPFGVSSSPTTATDSFDKDFDEGFGDHFEAPKEAAAPTAAPFTASPTFDSAFDSFDVSSASTAKAVVVEPVEEKKEEAAEEVDSSDDEDEIEDATPKMRHGLREASGVSSPVAGTSISDSGESFVHVPSASTSADVETETKFPALEESPEEVVAAPVHPVVAEHEEVAERSDSPTSELDTFEDAAAHPTPSGSHQLLSSVEPVALASTAAAATTAAVVAGVVVAKKRAAPPPPPARSGTASNTAFDDAFGSSFGTPSTSTAAAASTDDFDDAFSDLPPAAPIASSATAAHLPESTSNNAFDSFDDEFSFKSDFDTAAPTTSNSAFDDSFANFDSAPSHSSPTSRAPKAAVASGFSFDDAFSSPSPNANASPDYLSARPTAAPGLPARPAVTPALEDDVAGVKQIVAMGFSRTQAIDALEKYNYDVTRALNSMLNA